MRVINMQSKIDDFQQKLGEETLRFCQVMEKVAIYTIESNNRDNSLSLIKDNMKNYIKRMSFLIDGEEV
jgi:hypothetical protein